MQYRGKLYGKVGKHYFPLEESSDDFDKLKVEVERQKKEIDRLQRIIRNRPSQA